MIKLYDTDRLCYRHLRHDEIVEIIELEDGLNRGASAVRTAGGALFTARQTAKEIRAAIDAEEKKHIDQPTAGGP